MTNAHTFRIMLRTDGVRIVADATATNGVASPVVREVDADDDEYNDND